MPLSAPTSLPARPATVTPETVATSDRVEVDLYAGGDGRLLTAPGPSPLVSGMKAGSQPYLTLDVQTSSTLAALQDEFGAGSADQPLTGSAADLGRGVTGRLDTPAGSDAVVSWRQQGWRLSVDAPSAARALARARTAVATVSGLTLPPGPGRLDLSDPGVDAAWGAGGTRTHVGMSATLSTAAAIRFVAGVQPWKPAGVTPLPVAFHTLTKSYPAAAVHVDYPQLTSGGTPHTRALVNAALARAGRALFDPQHQPWGSAPEAKRFNDTSSYTDFAAASTLVDDRYASFVLGGDWYGAGAAHPNTFVQTFTFDLRTGKAVRLADLFRSGIDYRKLLAPLARASLRSLFGGDATFDGSSDDPTWPGAGNDNWDVWFLTADGIGVTFVDSPHVLSAPTVLFSRAQLSAYAAVGSPLAG